MKFISKMHEKQLRIVIAKIVIFSNLVTMFKVDLEKPDEWF